MDSPASALPLTAHESARRLGAFAWLESQLFEVLGGWVPVEHQPEVKLCLARHSHHHAWRAEQLLRSLPQLPDLGRDEALSPADAAAQGIVDDLRAIVEPERSADRLVGAYRMALPLLVDGYAAHRARCSAVSDAPVMRLLALFAVDLGVERAEGEALLATWG